MSMMSARGQPVNCIIKPPVSIKVGDTSKGDFHSGCSVVDVKFPNVFRIEIGEITFKNYYTAAVTIKAREKSSMSEGGDTKWRTLVRNMKLMPSPHCESCSQDYFTVKKKQMLFDPTGINGVRFILKQPSPVWKEFKVEEIKVYKVSPQTNDVQIPNWILKQLTMEETRDQGEEEDSETREKENQPNKYIEGLPHMDIIAEGVQQLWAMSEEVKAAQTRSALGRYDLDGITDKCPHNLKALCPPPFRTTRFTRTSTSAHPYALKRTQVQNRIARKKLHHHHHHNG